MRGKLVLDFVYIISAILLQAQTDLGRYLTFLHSQARYESQRIQLESELAVQLEQRVTERLAQAQESSLRQAASLREHHRYMGLTGCHFSQPQQVSLVPGPCSLQSLCHGPAL